MAQANRDPNAKSLPRFQFKNTVVVTGGWSYDWLSVPGCWLLAAGRWTDCLGFTRGLLLLNDVYTFTYK